MGDDARRVLELVRTERAPRYVDVARLFPNDHPRARAAIAELVDQGLLEHLSNGALYPLPRHHATRFRTSSKVEVYR